MRGKLELCSLRALIVLNRVKNGNNYMQLPENRVMIS